MIKLADVQAENDVETQFEYKFAELVNEKSDGRIEVQVYPAGQMGEMTDILTAVQSGSMQMNKSIMACRCRCFFNESSCASFRV